MAKPPSIPAPPGASPSGSAPLDPPRPSRPPSGGGNLDEHIAILRDRLDAEEDRHTKAVLSWQIGHLAERALDAAGAVKAYLNAYNLAPGFRPPLYDLIRIFERRRSFKNLARLYDAEQSAARRPDEAASAAADLAALIEDRERDGAKASHRLAEALTVEDTDGPGGGAAALFLERAARRTNDTELITQAMRSRVASTTHPVWRALLQIDLAEHLSEGGEGQVDEAFGILEQALASETVSFRVFEAMERIGRRHERFDGLVTALEGLGDLAAAAARGQGGGESGAFSVDRFTDQRRAAGKAGAYFLEAATIALQRLDDAPRGVSLLGRAAALVPDDPLLRLLHVEAAFRAGDGETVARAVELFQAAAQAPSEAVADQATPAEPASAESQASQDDDGLDIEFGAAVEADPLADLLPPAALVGSADPDAPDATDTEAGAAETPELEVGAATETGSPSPAAVVATAAGSSTDAVLLYYAAQAAAAGGHEAEALALAGRALQLAPDSVVAEATLDSWWLATGASTGWIDALEARADLGTDEDRSLAAWRGAEIAASLGEMDRAHSLFAKAVQRAPRPAPILRAWCNAMLRAGREADASEALTQLLAHDLEPAERSTWIFEQLGLGPAGERAATLGALLGVDAVRAWAPDEARLVGAAGGDDALVAKAHLALARRAEEDDLTAAHLCAAARSLARAGSTDDAVSTLEQALERVPGHAYAVALLEMLYRARGDSAAVVKLLREAAEAHGGTRAAVVELLLAGAAAEAANDVDTAKETYEQAADQAPDSPSPLRALERLARTHDDDELMLRAQEGLSARELALGETRIATLEMGEHYALLGKGALAESPLQSCLESHVGVEAALALSTLPEDGAEPAVRLIGLEKLLAVAEGADRIQLRREHGQTAEVDLLDLAAVEHAIRELAPDEVAEGEPVKDDVWAMLAALALTTDGDRTLRGEVWLRLADATSDKVASADIFLHGLRTKLVVEGNDAADDVFLLAQDLGARAPDTASARAGIEETLEPGDDPDARAASLLGVLEHASPSTQPVLRAAAGRALSAARRQQALEINRAVVEADPWDLAGWEALRTAARAAGAWEDVVRACDQLLAHLDGDAAHGLQEEAAAVLLDHLDDPAGAEPRLAAVFDENPGRPNAFHRLHDLLAERADAEALVRIVKRRIEATDEGLERLFYELARLHRSRGELDEALEAIENLVLLDEQHVGGLALAVEINVSRGSWAPAVDGLRLIAKADVPAKQKRISRLGAADFLEHKLDDPAGALVELAAVDGLGYGTVDLFVRMAGLAERTGNTAAAAAALTKAAAGAEGADKAAHARRAAELHVAAGDHTSAQAAYRSALKSTPTDLEAARALAALLPDPSSREALADEVEGTIRAMIQRDGLAADLLRGLRDVADWRGDRVFEQTVLQALQAIGAATPEESRAAEEETGIMTRAAIESIDDARLRVMMPEAVGPLAELARLLDPVLCELIDLTPTALGVGRRELVGSGPHPVRDEIGVLSRLFALPEMDTFVGGDDPGRLLAMPGKKRHAWVIGDGVRSPLHPVHRFLVAQQACALRLGFSALVRRMPSDGATMLHAVAAASDHPLAAGMDRAGLVDWTRRLHKAMPRKTRKAAATLAAQVPDGGRDVEAFCVGVRRGAMRAGALVGGDLTSIVTALIDEHPSLAVVRATADANDLIHFWISPQMIELRRSLGT